jgi:hypothetical protein
MNNKIFTTIITLIFVFIWVTGNIIAQDKKTCAFISAAAGPDARDVSLVNWLQETYEVTILLGSDVNSLVYTPEDFQAYDFVFLSESINSSDTEVLKGAPAPLFYTELWASKVDITGWVHENSTPAYYGSTSDVENTIKIINADHPLAAGFSLNEEVQIVTQTDGSNCLTYSVPEVDHIAVGVLTTNEDRVIVMGIEQGTELYNDSGVKDGTVFAQNRCAGVGIHADANNYITDDAKTLITAGINWILEGGGSSIDEEPLASPNNFKLEQNYPNPFNPETKITFILEKSAHTSLTVHNVLGQKVATLLDGEMSIGEHFVTFNGGNLPSGIYFYQLISGNYKETKKMILVK